MPFTLNEMTRIIFLLNMVYYFFHRDFIAAIHNNEYPARMTRTKAFLIHLGISAVIYLGLLYLIIFIWYPQPYFAADGGWQGIRLVTGIDMVLGPLLTLIVFKAGKPGLKFDLALIGILQTAALVWGTWTIYDQRTAMVTFAADTFFTMNTELVDRAGDRPKAMLAAADREPVYAIVALPADPRAGRALLKKLGPKPLYLLGEAYVPLEKSNLDYIFAQNINVRSMVQNAADKQKILNDFLGQNAGTTDDFAFLPLHCRYATLVLVLRRSTGDIVGALDLYP